MSKQAEKIYQDYIRSRVDWWHRALRKGVCRSVQADAVEGLGRLKRLV
jgi:hypothetical protein